MSRLQKFVVTVAVWMLAEIALVALIPGAWSRGSALGMCIHAIACWSGVFVIWRQVKHATGPERNRLVLALSRGGTPFWTAFCLLIFAWIPTAWISSRGVWGDAGFQLNKIAYSLAMWCAAFLWQVRENVDAGVET